MSYPDAPQYIDLGTSKITKDNTPTLDISQSSLDTSVIASKIHTLVNDERNALGLQSVKYDKTLEQASAVFAQKMINDGFFDHKAPDGTTVNSIATDLGYKCFQAPYYAVADNLAEGGPYYGQNTNDGIASETVQLWMDSEGHRANILTASHDSVGVGIAFDGGRGYLVLSFC